MSKNMISSIYLFFSPPPKKKIYRNNSLDGDIMSLQSSCVSISFHGCLLCMMRALHLGCSGGRHACYYRVSFSWEGKKLHIPKGGKKNPNTRLCLLTLWFNYCLKRTELAVNWFNYPICLFQAWFQQNCSSSGKKWQALIQQKKPQATITAVWIWPQHVSLPLPLPRPP